MARWKLRLFQHPVISILSKRVPENILLLGSSHFPGSFPLDNRFNPCSCPYFTQLGHSKSKGDFIMSDPQDKRESLVGFMKKFGSIRLPQKMCIYLKRNSCKNVSVFTKCDREKSKWLFPHFALRRQKCFVLTILSRFILPRLLYHLPIYVFTVLQRHHISWDIITLSLQNILVLLKFNTCVVLKSNTRLLSMKNLFVLFCFPTFRETT